MEIKTRRNRKQENKLHRNNEEKQRKWRKIEEGKAVMKIVKERCKIKLENCGQK